MSGAVLAKRDAGDKQSDDDNCSIYRYGSFCTGIEVFGELLLIGTIFIQTSEKLLLS